MCVPPPAHGSIVGDVVVVQVDVAGLADVDADRIILHFAARLPAPAHPQRLLATAARLGEDEGGVVAGADRLAQPVGAPAGPVICIETDDSICLGLVMDSEFAALSGLS